MGSEYGFGGFTEWDGLNSEIRHRRFHVCLHDGGFCGVG